MISISRSGSSSKERGKHIGYRGIGFKSITYLTDEIVIYSDSTYFTFSRKASAQKVNIDIDQIPIIRIPVLLESIDEDISCIVADLKKRGYKTIFIFKCARVEEFLEEMRDVNNGYFIFLKNIEQCNIELKALKKDIQIKREGMGMGYLVKFPDKHNDAWYVVSKNEASIGFKFDITKKKIVACSDSEQLYHSYLPTFDKVLLPIKVNADFSTDPSRKHITLDDKSEKALANVASIVVSIVTQILKEKQQFDWSNLFAIISGNGMFSRCNSLLKQKIKEGMITDVRLPLRSGRNIKINEYKLLPIWLAESEKNYLRMESIHVGKESLNREIYEQYIGIDTYIGQYTKELFDTTDIIMTMHEENIIDKIPPETQGKILGNIIRKVRLNPISGGSNEDIRSIKIMTEKGIKTINEISKWDIKILDAVTESLNNSISISDITWFCNKYSIKPDYIFSLKHYSEDESMTIKKQVCIKPNISRWRSAEQQCLEIEKYFGNSAIDVSKKNIGYDIESITSDGVKRYIEVKFLQEGGGVSLTNNEYTSAYQYGELYYLCLITQKDNVLKVIYINNPLENVNFEKRIKQWEWFCESYSGVEYTFEN